MSKPTRDEAFALLKTYNSNPALINHALAVEAVMKYIAAKRGENAEEWGLVGLVHDLDYEKFPEQHCQKTRQILEEQQWPEDYIRAIESHGWGICTQVEPINDMEKTLYTIDELTGLVAAAALVRPSKSVNDLPVKSVKKKWNQKSFAAGANREIIEKGAAMLDYQLDELIEDVIMGMRSVSAEIGL